MNKYFILTLFVFLLVSPVAYGLNTDSLASQGTIKQGNNITLIQTCGDCTYINITSVVAPDKTTLIENVEMTQDGREFTYFLLGTNKTYGNSSQIGTYEVNGYGNPSGDVEVFAFTYEVTKTGQQFSDGAGFSSLGIMAGALVLAFFFLTIAFRFSDNNNKPIGLFFGVIAVFLALYSLQMGLSFSSDILQYEGLSQLQSTMYIAILWLIGGISVISFILMSIGFVKKFGDEKMIKDFGQGFDPISQTYN